MRRIEYKEAISFLLPKHYSGRTPSITYAFGYYEDEALKAVCTFGKPASNNLCVGVCGKEYSANVYELNRLCVGGEIKIQLSSFVGWCLRQLKKDNLIIVSYADKQMNHNGYIYQATNFIYTGATKIRTDKYVEGGKHSRHYNNTKQNGLRKFRSSKHRYIFFACDKKHKKKFMNALKYTIEEYPKEENKRYVLGEYIEPLILKDGRPYKPKEDMNLSFGSLFSGVKLEAGTIVRGNWSQIEYKVEHCGNCADGWFVTGRRPSNPLQTGSFSRLGKRVGNEILITEPKRPDDRLLVVRESAQARRRKQMEFDL